MKILIIFFLIIIALSPFALLIPKKTIIHKSNIRIDAKKRGIQVRLVNENLPYWIDKKDIVNYVQYLKVRVKDTKKWTYWQNDENIWVDEWQEECKLTYLNDQLKTLPKDVYKVESNKYFLALYWGEKDTKLNFHLIEAFFDKIA